MSTKNTKRNNDVIVTKLNELFKQSYVDIDAGKDTSIDEINDSSDVDNYRLKICMINPSGNEVICEYDSVEELFKWLHDSYYTTEEFDRLIKEHKSGTTSQVRKLINYYDHKSLSAIELTDSLRKLFAEEK